MQQENNAALSVEPITSNLQGTHVVEKAHPLAIMRNIPFSLDEFKVLDTYLSRINARDSSHRSVLFSLDEYESLLGVSRIRPEKMEKYVENMMQKLVTIDDPEEPNGWRKFVLFGESRCFKDSNNKWWIELTCTEAASKLFFELKSSGYFKYHLSNVTSLDSLYSYYLYLYLVKNDYRGSWTEELDALKDDLCCTSPMYDEFKYFRKYVLDKAVTEINTKTDAKYSVEPVKKGKRVVAILFRRERSSLPPLDAEIISEDYDRREDLWEEADEKYEGEQIQFVAPACKNEFTQDEMFLLLQLINDVLGRGGDVWKTDLYNYLLKKYTELNVREKMLNDKGEKINNRFAYLKTMIEADIADS